MNSFFLLAALLCISLFFSCTPEIEQPPPPQNRLSSSSDDESSQIEQSSGDTPYSSFASSSPSVEPSSPSGEPPSSTSVKPSSSAGEPQSSPSIKLSSSAGEPPTSFELAAFIYDTDPSVHPDFSCGTWMMSGNDQCPSANANGKNTKCTCDEGPEAYSGAYGNLKPDCRGVIKGLAKQALNPGTRKIECDNCAKLGCWTDASWFSTAFASTPGVNVEHCYNMPLALNNAGNYEFDSDKMLNASGRLVGGFYPELLNSAPTDPSCPSCNTKRSADRFAPRVRELTNEIFDAYVSKEGDFSDGDTPPRNAMGVTVAGYPGCEWVGDSNSDQKSIYDWCIRTATSTAAGANPHWSDWFLHGTTALKNDYGAYQTMYDAKAKANQHFCFESHANFVYNPEQVFYITGDDDIWVYINNKLVIDLGGTHMAAPGHVNLSTQGLTEGNPYPIDIFFCDRRTTNSSMRITTNIPLTQTAEQKGACGGR